MSGHDVIPIPGHAGMYARRATVEAWQRAGSPPINDAARLKSTQQWLRDMYVARVPGFNPADDPNDPSHPMAHVRGVALDVPPWYGNAMRAAGFEMPYDYERWHFQLPNVWAYGLIESFPEPEPITEENPDMPVFIEPTTVSWPNGYTNQYDPNVFTVLRWVARGENSEPWAVAIYVSEAWKAAAFMADWNADQAPKIVVPAPEEIARLVAGYLRDAEVAPNP